ncbi:MAG: dihydroorotase [Sphingomonadales bacterium]|nr:dihydroorotase [Sphingomonadales bacterium]
MNSISIRDALLINEGEVREVNVHIQDDKIWHIDPIGRNRPADQILSLKGAYLMPGAIDDQVHFREPGLTHKGELATESWAAVAGGITSFMEMPNTKPAAITKTLLEQKYVRAAEVSPANYSFYLGATPDNVEELKSADYSRICGVKIFMGSSTGDLLVNEEEALDTIFRSVSALIALHCESDPMIAEQLKHWKEQVGEGGLTPAHHPLIRSREACYTSSAQAVELACKHGTRIHVLHISTKEELELFDAGTPLSEKRITAEVCVHHLWFEEGDYLRLGNRIKWNPAIKSAEDRAALRRALNNGRIDVVATDHAPHTLEEKAQPYLSAPSGGPLVQHSVPMMFDLVEQGVLSHTRLVELMCHNPAVLFRILNRGYVREGYQADLAVVRAMPHTVNRESLMYRCGWSPLEGITLRHTVESTLVNGHLIWHKGQRGTFIPGHRLAFRR